MSFDTVFCYVRELGLCVHIQSGTLSELNLALVVADGTGDHDRVTYGDLVSTFAGQTVALNGSAADIHGYGDVAVLAAVGGSKEGRQRALHLEMLFSEIEIRR